MELNINEMLAQLQEALNIHEAVRDRVNKLDEAMFMSLVGLMMDDWEAENNGDTVKMLEMLLEAAKDVHRTLGGLPKRA